jgi:uncharacterized damage-inducible protein DinB
MVTLVLFHESRFRHEFIGVNMSVLDYLRRQFVYDAWANEQVLTAIKSAEDASKLTRATELFGHILSAEKLWLERLRQKPQSQPVWPKSTIEQCEVQIQELMVLWQEYLTGLSESDLAKKISYKNSKGEPWTDAVQDILNHVVLHSMYHRGQVASSLRAAGVTPAYTDFIHAVRQGLIA